MHHVLSALGLILLSSAVVPNEDGLSSKVENIPTVRSEIMKGFESAPNCVAVQNPEILDQCFSQISADYRLTHSDTRAFEIGLNYRKWVTSDKFVELSEHLKDSHAAQMAGLFGNFSRVSALMKVQSGLKDLGVSEVDFFQLVGMSDRAKIRWNTTLN